MESIEVFAGLDMLALGQRVLAARERCGLTQEKLAWRAKLRVATLSELECGRRPGLRVHALYSLCQVLGLSADVLLGLRREDPA